MGTEIDRLEVQVEAQATKANNQLDKLIGKLEVLSSSLGRLDSSGLSNLSSGITKFAEASTHLSNIKTVDFTRLVKNIESLSSLDTQQIVSASSAINTLTGAVDGLGSISESSKQVMEVANSIGKLGSASVQRAITNLPTLASSMTNLMTTLSKAPAVSDNIIQMTNALAKLTSKGTELGATDSGIAESANNVGTAIGKTTAKMRGFGLIISSLRKMLALLKQAIKKLWSSIESSIESSMNYIETLNYFNAAFGQVAESAVSQWEEAGYDSAEAYYESFSSRAKELTSKMTGFSVNEDGTLTATGNASLGIDPEQLMNYQAMFAQMSSSIGVSAETSLKLSQALTEIGADLASVKNMDFDKVWQDMASGLAGMSRTLDKYGVNIRNVNLQQKLFDLGIDENIANLNQNDKALLRAIILLDSTRYAWGDLADTIDQPANQLRLLESNFNNLSRTIGNLFLPIVSKVLPYVNGLVIALQRLFSWVGSLLGLDLSKITSTVGSSDFDFGDLIEDTDDLTGGLNDAGEAAKKLKHGLQGFDELNVITTNDSSDSGTDTSVGGLTDGLLDAAFDETLSEYQAAWDDAFANMENRAQELADKIEAILQPVKDIIEDFAVGDFFKAGQDVSKLVVGINNFLAKAIDDVDWYGIGQKIGDFLAGIDWLAVLGSFGNLFWQGIKGAIELWAGSFDAAPIETGIISAIALLGWTGLAEEIGKIVEKFTKGGFLNNLGLVVENLFSGLSLKDSMIAVFGKLGTKIAGIGTIVIGAILAISNFLDMLNNGFSWVNEAFMILGIAVAAVGAVILGVPAGIAAGVAAAVAAIATVVIVVKENWDVISQFFVNLWNKIVYLWEQAPSWFNENILLPLQSTFSLACEKIGEFFSDLWLGIKKGFATAFNAVIGGIESAINWLVDGINDLLGGFLKVAGWLAGLMGEDLGTVTLLPKVSLGRIDVSGYEIGGFPKEYSLFMAGEQGKAEMLGTIGGKTAVAGGEEITGISDAIYSTSSEEVQLMREQNQLLRELLKKEYGISKSDVGKAARDYSKEYFDRTGRSAYIF